MIQDEDRIGTLVMYNSVGRQNEAHIEAFAVRMEKW